MKSCWLGILVVLMTAFCASGEEPQEKGPPQIFFASTNMDHGPNIETRVEIQQDGRVIIENKVWHNTWFRGYTANIRITFLDKNRNQLRSPDPFSYGVDATKMPFAAADNRHEKADFILPNDVSAASIADVQFDFWPSGTKQLGISLKDALIEYTKALHPPPVINARNVNIK